MLLLISTALASLPSCDALYAADASDPAVWDCVYAEARGGLVEDALAFVDAVQADDAMTGQAWLTTGNLYGLVRDDRVLDAYDRAVQAFAADGDAGGEVKTRMNWAGELRRRGDVVAGREQLTAAQDLAEGTEPFFTMVRIERARWTCDLGGDYVAALADLDASRPRLDDDGFPGHGKLLIHHTSACLAHRLGRDEASKGHYQDLLEFTEATGNDFVTAVTLDNLLWTEASSATPPADLLTRAQDALALADEVQHIPTVADLTCLVAHLQPDASFDDCLARADEGDDGPIRARAYRLAAERALADTRHEDARTYLEQAAVSVRESADYEQRIEWLAIEARYADAVAPSTAIDAGFTTLHAIETLRELQPDRLVRARTITPYADLYAEQAQRLRAARDLVGALAVIERLRGRQVLERLDRAAVTPALVPSAETWEERDALLDRIDALTGDPEQSAALAHATAQEEALRAELFHSVPAFSRFRLPDVDIQAVQSVLHPNEAALVPVLASPSWTLVVRQDAVHAVDLVGVDDITDAAQTFASLVQQDDALVPLLTEQFQTSLIAPVAAHLDGVAHLIIVPDAALHAVPWQTLAPAAMSVSYSPSLRTLADLRTQPPTDASNALLIADPLLSPQRADARDADLGALPGAVAEVEAVASGLTQPVTVLVGAAATQSAVQDHLNAPVRLLHIAAHAVVDPVDPGKTAIILASDDGSEARLTVDEVAQLDLSGAIVVLSGCRTADGEVHADGVVGLADAFLIAGARAVVASLFPLPDADASRTLRAMHRALARGSRLDDALHEAVRTAPNAGLRVLGDASVTLPSAVTPRRRIPIGAWALGGLVLAVLAITLWWRTR